MIANVCVMKENAWILYINEPSNKCNPNLHKYMNPRLHLWNQKEAMETIGNFTKFLSYIIIFKLTLGYPWATHKGSPRVAQEKQ